MYSQMNGLPARGTLSPVEYFTIKGRVLNLYYVSGRTESAPYSLYWDGEQNPLQHAMTALEVFKVLAGLLNEEE